MSVNVVRMNNGLNDSLKVMLSAVAWKMLYQQKLLPLKHKLVNDQTNRKITKQNKQKHYKTSI